MKKNILLFIFSFCLIMGFSFPEQKNFIPCTPQPGSCTTCDSIRKLYHNDVVILVLQAVQDSASPYYDSLFLPEKLISEYENALIAFYNGASDSLTMGMGNKIHIAPKDISYLYKFTLRVKKPEYEKWIKNYPGVGNKFIDSLFSKTHLTNSSVPVVAKDVALFAYQSDLLLNVGAIDRRLLKIKKTSAHISQPYYSSFLPSDHYGSSPKLAMKQSPEGFVITLSIPYGAGMPPELPFPVKTLNFLVMKDCTVKFISENQRK
jgi:hypothetical protein